MPLCSVPYRPFLGTAVDHTAPAVLVSNGAVHEHPSRNPRQRSGKSDLANPMSENQLRPAGLRYSRQWARLPHGFRTRNTQNYAKNIDQEKSIICTAGHARSFDFGFLGSCVSGRRSARATCAAVAGTDSIRRTGNVDTCASVVSQWTGFNRSVCRSTGATSSGSFDARNIE
jgi:hypothetical protein